MNYNNNYGNNLRNTAREAEMRARTGSLPSGVPTGRRQQDAKGKFAPLLVLGWLAVTGLFSIHPAIGILVLVAIVAFVIAYAVNKQKNTVRAGGMSGQVRPDDDHLCDPGQHGDDEERSSRATLDDMQAGYTSYSSHGAAAQRPMLTAPHPANSMMFRRSRLTREQLNKKTVELQSLRESGIISHDEYQKMLREYSAYVQ